MVAALEAARFSRHRTGATSWRVWQDAADANRVIEQFVVASWDEHLRQHERVTVRDQDRLDRAEALTDPKHPTIVTRWLTPEGERTPDIRACNRRQLRMTAHWVNLTGASENEPSGRRLEFFSICFVQHVRETFRRTPLAPRASSDNRPRVIGDTKPRRYGAVVEISIFPGSHATKPSKLRVQGGAETEARTVHWIGFDRIVLRPPQRRRADPRPLVHVPPTYPPRTGRPPAGRRASPLAHGNQHRLSPARFSRGPRRARATEGHGLPRGEPFPHSRSLGK